VASTGACVLFTGLVREHGACGDLQALELEHYPGMTEASIAAIVARGAHALADRSRARDPSRRAARTCRPDRAGGVAARIVAMRSPPASSSWTT
jgi:hypothetical protein